jgi:hypothetical protein
VAPGGLPGALADQPYDTSLQPVGGLGPYSYAITAGSLPPGLARQPDGEITGQASTDGTSSFTVSVTDSENPPATVTQAESITVTGGISSSLGLYWTDNLGDIATAAVTGGVPSSPQVLVNDQNGPAWVAASGGTASWADRGTGTIMAVPVIGSTPTVLASGQPGPAYVTANSGTVYWADRGTGTIVEIPEAGGTNVPAPLASGQPGPAYLAADNGTVYWIDSNTGTIMSVPAAAGTPSAVAGSSSGTAYLAVGA